MAEQEVVKHTKKVYKVWTSKEHSIWHKVKEFLVEIFIIVFAITLSIWVHDRSEHAHQQKEVKEFLLGLKDDLTNDLTEMEEDVKSYHGSEAAFLCISNLKPKEQFLRDSMNKHSRYIFNTTGLVANDGRFEGFKSSGKIGTIEDAALQNDIMDLYQENIPLLILSTDEYSVGKKQMINYIQRNRKRVTDSTSNILQLLSTDEAYYLSQRLTSTNEIYDRYATCIQKMKKIIATVDSLYGH